VAPKRIRKMTPSMSVYLNFAKNFWAKHKADKKGGNKGKGKEL